MRVLIALLIALLAAMTHADDILLVDHLVSYWSYEGTEAAALGLKATIATEAQWRKMSTKDFASYKAIVISDPGPGIDPSNIQFLADTADVWGPAIQGNIIIHGTDSSNHGATDLIYNSIKFAVAGKSTKGTQWTGLYLSLTQYYDYDDFANVNALKYFGNFTVRGDLDCYNQVKTVASSPALGNLTDTYLSNWDCSVHEAFSSYPTSGKDGFQALAIADGITGVGTQNFAGGIFGLPYIISRGATPAGCGDGNWDKDLGEECDDGNIEDGDECSRSCKCESGRAKGDGTCYPSAGDTEGLIRMPEAFIEVDYFTATYMMVVVSVLFQSLWGIVHAATKMIEPFYQLHKEGGASAAESLLSDYLSAGPSMESVMNVFRKHWVMTLTSAVYVFATMGMMVASESMTIRSGNSCNTPDEPLKCDLQWVIDTRIARCLQVFMGLSAAMILARIILDRRRASGVSTYPCTIAATAALLRNPGIMNSFNHIDPEAKSKHIKKALSQNHYGIRRFESPPSIWSYGLVQIAAPKAPVWWHPGNFMTSMKEAWSSVKAYQPGPHPATVAPDQRPGAAPSSGSSEVAVVPPATEVLVEESSTKHKVSPAREALWRNVKLGFLLTVQLAFFGVFLYYRLTDNAVLFVNKTKGVRMGLTAIAILIQFGWQWLEAEVRVMTPYRRLTKPNTESRHVLEMSLHGVPLVTFWRAMWHGNFYHALIAATAVVSQILIIGVAGIPYNFGIIQNVSLFSSTVCLGVLAIQLVVGCSVYWWRRSDPVMPRSPNTIANVVMLLCDSKMLQHFDGLGHSPASEEDLRDRTIGRQYHFGEKQGADGKKRLQIEVREVDEDSISEEQV